MLKTLLKWDKWINFKWLNGHKGETISSRLGRRIEDKDCFPCRVFCRTVLLPLAFIFKQGGKHCRESIQDKYRGK